MHRIVLVGALVALAASARAAGPKVIEVEVEHDQFHYLAFLTPPPQATAEPGGFLVPDRPAPEWTAIGLQPGDVIRYVNGSAAADRMLIGEGVTLIELERAGRRVILRVTVHGKPQRAVTLTQHAFDRVVDQARASGLATPVMQDGKPSGVRILDMLLSLHVELSPGDVVRTIDGQAIRTEAELSAALQNLRVGTTPIVFEREGREIRLDVMREPALDLTRIKKLGANRFEVPHAVIAAIDADSELVTGHVKAVLAATGGKIHGVKLVEIEPGSLCAAIGLVAGDVVLDIDGHPIDTSEDAFRTEAELASEPTITVHVERRGKPLALVYTIR